MRDRVEAMTDEVVLDERITRALERPPAVVVPRDFAAKVRAALPEPRKVRTRRSVGRIAALVGAAVLMVGVCVLAPYVRPSFESVAFDMEMLLVVELAAVSAWLAVRADGM